MEFDYDKAVDRLEKIASIVENPDTGIDDIEKYINETKTLVESCRNYLRTQRESVSKME